MVIIEIVIKPVEQHVIGVTPAQVELGNGVMTGPREQKTGVSHLINT